MEVSQELPQFHGELFAAKHTAGALSFSSFILLICLDKLVILVESDRLAVCGRTCYLLRLLRFLAIRLSNANFVSFKQSKQSSHFWTWPAQIASKHVLVNALEVFPTKLRPPNSLVTTRRSSFGPDVPNKTCEIVRGGSLEGPIRPKAKRDPTTAAVCYWRLRCCEVDARGSSHQ